MKVFTCPKEVSYERLGYRDFDLAKEQANIESHKANLKKYLIGRGFIGKNTGEVVSFSVADGSALYMIAEGPKTCLIHLPYWDAYQFPYVHRITKKEILDKIKSDKKIADMFKKK